MSKWLIKSDPEEYGWSELLKEKHTLWTGVRNYQARNNMRAMKKNDDVLFYHSNLDMAIVGVCKVNHEAIPDPTANEGDWSSVEIKAVSTLKNPVTLAQIKANKGLQQLGLVRNARLSVMAVNNEEWDILIKLSEKDFLIK